MACENKKIIKFKITHSCNFSCDYCNKKFLWDRERKNKFVETKDETIDNFKRFVENLNEKVVVNLFSDGEIFTHTRAFDVIESVLKSGHDLVLSSNFSSDYEVYEKLVDLAKTSELNLFISIHNSQINPEDFYNKLERFNSSSADKKNINYYLLTTEKNDLTTKISENFNKKIYYLDLYIKEKPVFYYEACDFFIENFLFSRMSIDFQRENQCQAGVVSCEIDEFGNVFRCNQELKKGKPYQLGNLRNAKKIRMLKQSMPCLCESCFYKNEQISIKKTFKNVYYIQKFIMLEEIENIRIKIKKELIKIKRKIFGDRILLKRSKNG